MSGVLLDTHTFLSLLLEPERVPSSVRQALDTSPLRYLSVASVWEMSIKYSIGKLPLPEQPSTYVPSRAARLLVQSLPITERHALRVATLPLLHRDPFDRLLIAQAIEEDLQLLTLDRRILRYAVPALRVRDSKREKRQRRQ